MLFSRRSGTEKGSMEASLQHKSLQVEHGRKILLFNVVLDYNTISALERLFQSMSGRVS